MSRQTRYSPEVQARAGRMMLEHQGEHASEWAAISSIASKIGGTAETLRGWVAKPSVTRACAPASKVYSVRQVRRQLRREGIKAARCPLHGGVADARDGPSRRRSGQGDLHDD